MLINKWLPVHSEKKYIHDAVFRDLTWRPTGFALVWPQHLDTVFFFEYKRNGGKTSGSGEKPSSRNKNKHLWSDVIALDVLNIFYKFCSWWFRWSTSSIFQNFADSQINIFIFQNATRKIYLDCLYIFVNCRGFAFQTMLPYLNVRISDLFWSHN